MKKLIAISLLLLGTQAYAAVCKVNQIDTVSSYSYQEFVVKTDDQNCTKAFRACNAVLAVSQRAGVSCVLTSGPEKSTKKTGWNTNGFLPKGNTYSPGYWSPIYGY